MSDVQGVSEAQDNGSNANLVYILYLVALVVGGLTAVIGLVLAYMNWERAPAWLRSHYEFQIRTFWVALLGAIATYALAFAFVWMLGTAFDYMGILIAIFVLIAFAFYIWWIVRCIKGMRYVARREPYPDYQALLW
jgi:uncharacterized membrane protein